MMTLSASSGDLLFRALYFSFDSTRIPFLPVSYWREVNWVWRGWGWMIGLMRIALTVGSIQRLNVHHISEGIPSHCLEAGSWSSARIFISEAPSDHITPITSPQVALRWS